jgi:exosortase/archaeosortase family protein
MNPSWESITLRIDEWFPAGSPRRKLLLILAIILFFEGISVLILFSYQGVAVGLFSLALGALLLLLLHPGSGDERKLVSPKDALSRTSKAPDQDPLGLRMIDAIVNRIGNDYVLMGAGAAIIVIVVLWNAYLSARPDYGDLDTLAIMLGGMVLLFPYLVRKFKVEASFSILFIGLVVVLLVVPQAVTSIHEDAGSSVGNWYVHYMLAAPFAGILNLIGIDASSNSNVVSLQFHDGTRQALSISAYCAGLYSFSIFLAAFASFVLVFERLPAKTLSMVLALGLLVAYMGNLFRMVVIGVVGYYNGLAALLWTHKNVGWIIFLGWSAVFWYLVIRFADRHARKAWANESK